MSCATIRQFAPDSPSPGSSFLRRQESILYRAASPPKIADADAKFLKNLSLWLKFLSLWACGLSLWACGLSLRACGLSLRACGLSLWACGLSLWACGLSLWACGLSLWACGLSLWACGLFLWGLRQNQPLATIWYFWRQWCIIGLIFYHLENPNETD